MIKKLLVMTVSIVTLAAFSACTSPTEEQPEEKVSYEIAMVTDESLIMDGGYSEVAWKAISSLGAESGISHKYYKAAEASDEAYRDTIDEAVSKGAKIIVADGYNFENVIYEAQKEYKDVNFVLIDAEPVDKKSGKTKIKDNTTVVYFASEEAGYMAGYAAVENGYTQLGFLGEADVATVGDYGYGFLQGADAAAEENGVEVNVKYHSCNEHSDSSAVVKKAKKWYESGVEVIFACGRQVEKPIIEAAELSGGVIIACETDKSRISDTIITSAVKDFTGVLHDILHLYAKGEFPGGEVSDYDTSTDSLWINLETCDMENFNETDYKYLMRKLKNKNADVKDHTVGEIKELSLSHVSVKEE